MWHCGLSLDRKMQSDLLFSYASLVGGILLPSKASLWDYRGIFYSLKNQ